MWHFHLDTWLACSDARSFLLMQIYYAWTPRLWCAVNSKWIYGLISKGGKVGMHAVLRLFMMLKFSRCLFPYLWGPEHQSPSNASINPCLGMFPAQVISQPFLAWSCDQGIEFQMSNSTLHCSSMIPFLMDFVFFTDLSPLSLSSGHCCQSTARFSVTSPTLVFHEHTAISSVSPSRSPISSVDMTFSQDPAYLLTSISSHFTLLSSPLSVLCLPFPSTQLH